MTTNKPHISSPDTLNPDDINVLDLFPPLNYGYLKTDDDKKRDQELNEVLEMNQLRKLATYNNYNDNTHFKFNSKLLDSKSLVQLETKLLNDNKTHDMYIKMNDREKENILENIKLKKSNYSKDIIQNEINSLLYDKSNLISSKDKQLASISKKILSDHISLDDEGNNENDNDITVSPYGYKYTEVQYKKKLIDLISKYNKKPSIPPTRTLSASIDTPKSYNNNLKEDNNIDNKDKLKTLLLNMGFDEKIILNVLELNLSENESIDLCINQS